MKKLLLLLLFVPNLVLAQQSTPEKYNFNDFNLIVNVDDQEKYYNEMLQATPAGNIKPALLEEYLTNLAIGWLYKGNLEKYRFYMKTNPNISFISLLNFAYALEYLEKENKNMVLVEEVSKEIINKIDNSTGMDETSKGRLQVLLEINAMANARLGNIDVAKIAMEKASTIKGDREIKYFKDSKANYYRRYSIVLSSAGENKRALDTLVNAVKNADSNPMLINTLKEIYIKVYGSDKNLDKYISSLQEEAYRKYYSEVEKLYITDNKMPFKGYLANPSSGKKVTLFTANKHAFDVSIPDLNGKIVNFSDFKGKILVIDFWTTACTPCVAAFAGFDRVIADYSKEAFKLFVINIFEPQEVVKSFVAKKGISLDVLRDEPNEKYNIQGTPTKIIFDPMGNIRFYSCGYAGSTDREYYKLKAMVEIVKIRANIKN